MDQKINKVCGIDVHKLFVFAAIMISGVEEPILKRFSTDGKGLLELRNWLKENDVERVAMESTGIYWRIVYWALQDCFEMILANAKEIHDLKQVRRKTDKRDCIWIARLCLNNMITPSYVPTWDIQQLKDLFRARVNYVEMRTECKNIVHKHLDIMNIRLGTCLSDIFGKAGTQILNDLVNGCTIDQIMERITDKRILKKKEDIMHSLQGTLNSSSILIIKVHLESIQDIDAKISELDAKIDDMLQNLHAEELRILLSIPGVGSNAAANIISEIGDVSLFETADQLTSWAGLAPSSHSSGGKVINGRIGKTGNRYLRRILIQVAHAAARTKGSVLGKFYRRVMRRRGAPIAIVALARKILAIVHHLWTNLEPYEEPGFKKKVNHQKVRECDEFGISGAFEIIGKAENKIGTAGGGCG